MEKLDREGGWRKIIKKNGWRIQMEKMDREK